MIDGHEWDNLTAPGVDYYYPDGDGAAFWKSLRHRPDVASELAVILAEGNRLLVSPVEELTHSLFAIFETQGLRLEYERVYFEKRRRLNTFAILSLLEPESEVYEVALLDAVWSICSELTWCLPAHVNAKRALSATIDLFSAETGFALAELRLLFGERLPEPLRTRIAELVDERLFRPFVEQGPYEWEEAEHNWSAVCAGSIGSAALLLLEAKQDRSRLARILEKTERSISFYLRGFGDDGACLEGLGYWNYGFGYFVYYADLLLRRSGGRRDWFQNDQVRRIATFQQKCFLNGPLVVNFSDALSSGSVHPGLSHYLADRYTEVETPPASLNADYCEDHCSRWAPALRNLIWRHGDTEAPAHWGAGDFYLPDAGWLISRVSRDGSAFGFAAKGGHNDEPHNHNDLGHFLLAGGGELFLCDLGCGEYKRDYFGDGRYAYDCNGSQGHSVPVIDGCLQSAGQGRSAAVLDLSMGEYACRLSMELSGAYECGRLESFQRTWIWDKTGLPSLSLQDKFLFAELPGGLTERFVTPIRPEYAGPGRLRLSGGLLALEIQYDSERLSAEVVERTYRNHFGKDTIWYTLDFQVRNPEICLSFEFLFRYIPLKGMGGLTTNHE
ncbi:heparinase II/III family protein [Paenibacillus donghaensis]|uniref:heparinase II/III family protein n=1 Tax=Paenibacillus donghaensis TaxID=414771 RepID=UPI0012FD596B|nr:heparinase II/III family protein [Paenibacillus donghaensis]